MKLPFLKQRADLPRRMYGRCVADLLGGLGFMPVLYADMHSYPVLNKYDVYPPAPYSFEDAVKILATAMSNHITDRVNPKYVRYAPSWSTRI